MNTSAFSITDFQLQSFVVNYHPEIKDEEHKFQFAITFREEIRHTDEMTIWMQVIIYTSENMKEVLGKIETATEFHVPKLREVLNDSELHKQTLAILVGITVSTTRGVLLAKGSGTILQNFILPILDTQWLVENQQNLAVEPIVNEAEKQIAGKNFEKAIQLYTDALLVDETNQTALFKRAEAYQKNKQIQEAIDDYSKLIYFNADSADAYCNRARLYKTLNKTEKATADYNKAIEINPSFSKAYMYRGILQASSNNNESALKDFTSAVDTDNTNAKAYYNRAIYYFRLGNNDLAFADYNRAIEIDPVLSEIYMSKGFMFIY